VLREYISVGGIPLHVLDTAGLRESTDPVEQEGMRRAWEAIARADRVLLVVDATVGRTAEDDQLLARLPSELPVTVVYNKIDLSGAAAASQNNAVWLSARGGEGLDLLRDHLREVMGVRSGIEGLFLARRRHLDALARTGQHLSQAATVLAAYRAGELLAEELRLAQQALGEITGEVTSDDLLGHIFSSFCIGK
jgi:tRNA modification GTPase